MKEDERKVEGSLRGHIQVLRGLSPPLGCTGNHHRIPAKSVIYAHSLTRTIRAEAAVDAVHELLYCA